MNRTFESNLSMLRLIVLLLAFGIKTNAQDHAKYGFEAGFGYANLWLENKEGSIKSSASKSAIPVSVKFFNRLNDVNVFIQCLSNIYQHKDKTSDKDNLTTRACNLIILGVQQPIEGSAVFYEVGMGMSNMITQKPKTKSTFGFGSLLGLGFNSTDRLAIHLNVCFGSAKMKSESEPDRSQQLNCGGSIYFAYSL